MTDWLEPFFLAFIPLFIAIDIIGLIPIYLSLASNVEQAERRIVERQAVTTALLVGVCFLYLGNLLFQALNITVGDFQIAGGLILLALAGRELLSTDVRASFVTKDFGVVPLGMPLIAGPGMLTSLLTVSGTQGAGITLLALIANLVIVLIGLHYAQAVSRLLGVTLIRAFSRIVALLLAAIAVNLIRRGWQAAAM